jgi:hypothetical protein
MPPRLITPRAAAERLGVSYDAVHRRLRRPEVRALIREHGGGLRGGVAPDVDNHYLDAAGYHAAAAAAASGRNRSPRRSAKKKRNVRRGGFRGVWEIPDHPDVLSALRPRPWRKG